jgi:AcrR family transcriptional regulator
MGSSRTRREEYSDATRRALLDAATSLFAEHGYPDTSLDQVAAACRVTKGAVYHHFPSKQALFGAVLDEVADATCEAIIRGAAGQPDAWSSALAGLDVFLERCLDPIYIRLCFHEGPAALGFSDWWDHGERHEMGLVRAMLEGLKAEGLIELDEVETLTQLLFGCVTAAALAIARAEDPAQMSSLVKATLERVLLGLHPRGTRTPRSKRSPRA